MEPGASKHCRVRSVQAWAETMLLIAVSSCFSPAAFAQGYPAKPIRYIVPSSPGGGNDTMARVFADELAQTVGQQVIVENRAGAAGNIAAEGVARSAPDGYTVLQLSQALVANASLYRNLPYDLVRDFAPVTMLAIEPYIVVVHPSLPVKSINELVALARTKPGTLNYPSAGSGTMSFVSTELFKSMAGIDIMHVPYKGGGPALISVVSGETSIYFGPIPPILPHIQQGRLRAIAVATAKRLAAMPNLPTVGESVTGYESANWYGLLVPAKTPKETIAVLNRASINVLGKSAVNKRLVDIGYIPMSSASDEFGVYVRAKVAELAKIIRQTGATVN